jgi:adhesin transport system membrane fusion protein
MKDLDIILEKYGQPMWRRRDRIILFALLIIVVWMCVAQVDQVVTVPGKVIPHSKVKVVQHLEGGIIKKILIQENAVVKAGDVLMELDLATSGLNKGEIDARMAALRMTKTRLESESRGSELKFPEDLAKAFPDLMQTERATWNARRVELEGGLSALSSQIAQNKRRVSELQEKLISLEKNLVLARREAAISEELLRDKLTSQLEHLQRLGSVERMTGEIAMIRHAIPSAQAALEESMARRREEEGRFRRRAADELSEIERRVTSISEEQNRATDQESRALVRSPIEGVVKNLRFSAAGNVIKSGEPIMEVVPNKEELVIEANLNPANRGHVQKGQFALVKISAYDFVRYGGLDGKVTAIAADTDVGKNEESFFRVRVVTDRAYLGEKAGILPITSGMQAEVDIHVDKRPLIWLLLKPVLKLKQEALREF